MLQPLAVPQGKAFLMPRLSVWPVLLSVLVACILFAGCPPPAIDPSPEARFTATVRAGSPPLEVQFSDTSDPGDSPIVAHRWDFDDGTTSTRPNPVHTFFQPGSYTISLSVTTARGTDVMQRIDYVVVSQPVSFQAVGPEGGTVASAGVSITVEAGALDEEVVFSISEAAGGYLLNPFEPTTLASAGFSIAHNGATGDLYASALGAPLQPATLRIPFLAGTIPATVRNQTGLNDKVQILARLDSGETIPILCELDGNVAVASVPALPAEATYAVVYRPEAYFMTVDVPAALKSPTSFSWPTQWRVSISPLLLQQLTALREGSAGQLSVYNRRDFSEQARYDAAQHLRDLIQALQQAYTGAGFRKPFLIESGGSLSLALYNLSTTYPSDFSSFRELLYRDHTFGSVVIDPAQLLAVTMHYAREANENPNNVDIQQKLGFENAFAEELFLACYDGYDFPSITQVSPADFDEDGNPLDVNFLTGLREGIATYLGQYATGILSGWATGQPYARAFEENEFSVLSQPLLVPFDGTISDFGRSNQEFFFYLHNRYPELLNPSLLPVIGDSTAPVRGFLEETRRALVARLDSGRVLDFDEALLVTYQAIDRALRDYTQGALNLTSAYWEYVQDRGVANSEAAMLRPSDADLTPLRLNEDRFAEDSTVKAPFEAPTDFLEVSANSKTVLQDIPPMATRLIVLRVHPLSSELTLTFNTDEWEADGQGNTLAVAVYQPGEAGVSLLEDGEDTDNDGVPDTLAVYHFLAGQDECYADVAVLVSNLNLEDNNSFAMTAQAFAGLPVPESQVLDRYVNTCDPNYEYNLFSSEVVTDPATGISVNTYLLHMTSGAWRGAADVDQTLWKHFVTIIEPPEPNLNSKTALLVVSGGSTNTLPSSSLALKLGPFSVATGTVVALIQAVPNQPLLFDGELQTRSEDAIIAYSYDQYAKGYDENRPDMTWPALLPMTRAAVRAMDSIQDFMLEDKPGQPIDIDNFVVTGASKRGWTTWLAAAADPRVSAAMPIVIDVLNMDLQMAHHKMAYQSYAPDDTANGIVGGYSESVQDYVGFGIFDNFDTGAGNSLLQVVDPFEYRARLTMPKFILNSTGDQFFLPDSSRFYLCPYSEVGCIPGDNKVYFAPNTDHGLTNSSLSGLDDGTYNSMLAYYIGFVYGLPMPEFTWRIESDNTQPIEERPYRIVVESGTEPTEVRLWQANASGARDFRLRTIGENWTSTVLEPFCDDCGGDPGYGDDGEGEPQGEGEGEEGEGGAEGEGEGEGEGQSGCECPLEPGVPLRYAGFVPVPTGDTWTAFFVQMIYPGPQDGDLELDFAFSTPVVVVPDIYPVPYEE